MSEEELRQQIRDEEHLKLLSLGYKLSAAVAVFFSLFALLYVAMGAIFLFIPSPPPSQGEPSPAVVGLFISGVALVFFLLGLALAGLKWRTAVCLKQCRSLTFCQVIAGISCLWVPYGTMLGVLTFIVLGRPSVKQLFKEETAGAAK